MHTDRQIKEAIQHLAGTHNKDEIKVVQCEVESVDVDTRTCNVVTISGLATYTIENVALMSAIDDGVLILPKVGSIVSVIHNKKGIKFVSQFSEVESIVIITGDTTIEIKDGLVQFNDGSFDGLVKIKDLVDKLNNLENLVNQFIGLYNGHVHTSNGVVTFSVVTKTLTPTQQSDLENTKITHGK
jgi:hypothetical protein